MCDVADITALMQNLQVYNGLTEPTQNLVRPLFQLDMSVHQFRNIVIQYDAITPSGSASSLSFNHVDTADRPRMFARRTGEAVGPQLQREAQYLNNINHLEPDYAITPADLTDLHPHELHTLRTGKHLDFEPHLVALLQTPKHIKKACREAGQCLLCSTPLNSPKGHGWRNCPSIAANHCA
jgi:hypothetical protein